jgi:hypothetical protein
VLGPPIPTLMKDRVAFSRVSADDFVEGFVRFGRPVAGAVDAR